MRVFAWVCIAAGILLAVAAFLITAHSATISPWPSFVLGFLLAALGIVLLAVERNLRP
jgi:uncharacterized membrane protein HdeD (DUF308 family)